MKKVTLLLIVTTLVIFSACTSTEENVQPNEVTPEIMAKIEALGFNTKDFPVHLHDGNLVVENDIVFRLDQLDFMSSRSQFATEEHYSTDNLVTGLPRTINVYVSTSFPQKYFDAVDAANARYNAENLTLTFQRVGNSNLADISFTPSPWWYRFYGILGSAGFPTAAGDPYNEILLTRAYYDNVTDLGALTTTIAHEMGHCIGFRHTDYMDRSFSCGGATDNEGASDIGANLIPGTPSSPEVGSWMLACSDGTNRPFTSGDVTALNYLY
ncbi:M57 family metalloprotease [Sediminitomix flava]|uniref:Dual-action HEIGH metallo-peptidase n=1 Tax=Sediminitomix flava TaxID=379075 RepID=A0A315ZEF0_SEDFL|nr:M57 family metalloprotease [Sediminitomix flava]PWJ43945.1 dual-action HEIGH metallo-peptidase [Sediminitomix flava]